ncbi:LysR family transcriptional regulator [Vibrio vulnificus]|uniref:LysR family transcriptional regulator n=1 Tax=Vibrio vulnificus TaxID=672 RepID=UPI00215D1FE5|nr:LysR family transcriptional regulator [Vibrio vulnificus]MCR9705358.1 LysR family transcriptional regulator [Vibrio vulnificus]
MEERITLKMLRYFDKVAQLGQFSRAAEQLNITKSPLSAQIKELEEVLGTALFERNTRNVQLTKAGEQLQAECVTLFAQFERSIHRVKQCAREEKQQLDIGLMSSIFWAGFGPAFHALQQLMPHATLNLLELSPEKQVRQLLMHQIDLGLVRFADTRDVAPLLSECLYQESMVVALPSEHPLAQRGQLTLSDLTIKRVDEEFSCFSITKSADFVMLKQENSSLR